MSGFVTACLLFATVIGSYRIFIVYAIHSLIRALNIEKKYIALFLPAYLVSFYLDVTSGPILTATNSYFLILFLIAFVGVDPLVQILFQRIVNSVTDNQFFIGCPSCHFHNAQLVETCSKCSYKKGVPVASFGSKISPDQKGDIIPNGLIDLLNLDSDEEIVFHKKLTSNYQKLKNEVRVVRKHFIITNKNAILLDYYMFYIGFPKSWREKDVIPLHEIKTVEGMMKIFMKSNRPFLIIKTIQGDVHEVVFSTFGNYIEEINQIAAIIKGLNPETEVNLNLIVPEWNKQIRFTPDMVRAILLVIFLMIIFYYSITR
jgi:hypothetical protein